MFLNYKRKKLKKGKILKKLARFLIFFTCLFLLAKILFFSYQQVRKSIWDGRNNLNLIIQVNRTFIYSYHPQDEILNIIDLPNNIYLETAKGYGAYKLENIYKLGEMENVGGGGLLRITLQEFFNAPMDGEIIQIPNQEIKTIKKCNFKNGNLEKGKLLSLYFCLLSKNIKTSFSWWDLIRFYWQINGLKLNQVQLIKLEDTSLFKKEKLADGSEVFRLEPLLVDDFSQKYFRDKSIGGEAFKIIILNATDFPAIAQNTAKLLSNIGGRVISTKDSQLKDKSVIYFLKPKYKKSYSLKKISRVLEIKKILPKTDLEQDIEIILGRDFLEYFYLNKD